MQKTTQKRYFLERRRRFSDDFRLIFRRLLVNSNDAGRCTQLKREEQKKKNSLSTQSDGVQSGFRTESNGNVLKKWYARGESNPNLRSRSPAFYPLKYRRTSYNSRPQFTETETAVIYYITYSGCLSLFFYRHKMTTPDNIISSASPLYQTEAFFRIVHDESGDV